MLLINCPYCGERDESEFIYGGRRAEYPGLDITTTDQDWHQIIHLHDYLKKAINEYWYHEFGCEQWIAVSRDPDSHEMPPSLSANSLIAQDKN